MSNIRKSRIAIIVFTLLISFFAFGCKKDEVKVQDIYFNLNEGKQMILFVGDDVALNDFVVIRPSNAANKQYTIETMDPEVVLVEGNTITAMKEGNTQIKVTSSENSLKQDWMTVVVSKTQTNLSAPKNLTYNPTTHSFSFNPVTNASSYTLSINDDEIELGNSNIFNLADYSKGYTDKLLSVKVKANAPTYTTALITSQYSNPVAIYQTGEITNSKVLNGELFFEKPNTATCVNIYFNDELYIQNSYLTKFSLTNLNKNYAGTTLNVKLELVPNQDVKDELIALLGEENITFYSSSKKVINVNILALPELQLTANRLSWQNVAFANGYEIYVDGAYIETVKNNYYDLKTSAGAMGVITSNSVHKVKVQPILNDKEFNIGKTNAVSEIKVQQLSKPTLSVGADKITWLAIDNVSAYAVELTGEAQVSTSIPANVCEFSMLSYNAGDYIISVQAIAKSVPDENDVYYLTSLVSDLEFSKQEEVVVSVSDYVLSLENLLEDEASVKIDGQEINSSDRTKTTFDLINENFSAGEHTIEVKRLGNANSVESNISTWNFVQLGSVDKFEIVGGVATAEANNLILQAIRDFENTYIQIVTKGGSLTEDIVVKESTYTFNTTNKLTKPLLSSGAYTTEVYVVGNGSSTFSYRENGVDKACYLIAFNVLEIPTLFVERSDNSVLTILENEKAQSFKVFENGVLKENNPTEIALNNGETKEFSAQAIGNGSTYLDSQISTPISVKRLSSPTLAFNRDTNVVTYTNSNLEAQVNKLMFTQDGEEIDYNFEDSLTLLADTTFTIQALANVKVEEDYFLDSIVTEESTLKLDKLNNTVEMSINANNQLVLETAQAGECLLTLVFTFGDGEQTFTTDLTSGKVLTNESETLPYSYDNKVYTINLIDASYNVLHAGFKEEFTAKVKLGKVADKDGTYINSEFSASSTLNLIHVPSACVVDVNTKLDNDEVLINNQLTITPQGHDNKEYGLVVQFNDDENLIFKSNGSGKLISVDNKYTLNYTYNKGVYLIDMLDEHYNIIVEELVTSFTVKVQFTHSLTAVEADMDSVSTSSATCPVKTVDILPKSTFVREGENLKIYNVNETYTYLNYAIYINNSIYLFLKDCSTTVDGRYIVVDMKCVFDKINESAQTDINFLQVLSLNNATEKTNPILTNKSDKFYFAKTNTVTLLSDKDNSSKDNYVVVSFETYSSPASIEEKEYVVEISNADGSNLITNRYDDSLASILINLDNFTSLENDVMVKAYVKIKGNYVDENTIELFNSNVSNVLTYEKISNNPNLKVENSILTWDKMNNVVGYEIYEKTTNKYEILNSELITENSFDLKDLISGSTKEIVIKSISAKDGYTNSNYSEPIKVNKLQTPTVTVENGKVKVQLSTSLLELLETKTVDIKLEVVNSLGVNFDININEEDNYAITKLGENVYIEPYLFLNYNSATLMKETFTVQIKNYTLNAVEGIYYLNSNVVEKEVYGLFEPTIISKTTENNDLVELITWTPSNQNTLSAQPLNVGYVFRVTHTVGENSNTYYSNDLGLKYLNTEGDYVSYADLIVGTSAIFPAGYDEGNDGTLDVLFDTGSFVLSVQAVPMETRDGYELCNSKFVEKTHTFTILEKVVVDVENGSLSWVKVKNSTKYSVSVYKQGEEAPLVVDSVANDETKDKFTYNFTNTSLNGKTGVFKVVVRALSDANNENTINGKDSEAIYVYRLPQATAVAIDDGHLILTATPYFTNAKIEFIDTSVANQKNHVEHFDNSELAEEKLSTLNPESWQNFSNTTEIETAQKFAIKLTNEVLSLLSGRNYTINVQLMGNSNINLAFIDSSIAVSLSNLTANKLKPNLVEVTKGVMQFKVAEEYADIVNTLQPNVDLNYQFNGATSSSFWHNTVIYRLDLTYSAGTVPIYAVDYYSFIKALEEEKTNSAGNFVENKDYKLIQNYNDLYAIVYYPYNDGEEKTLIFNVFKENTINLMASDYIRFYQINETNIDGVNKLETVLDETNGYKEINLAVGGSFNLNVFMLGGDSVANNGHLSAFANEVKTFYRYGINQLSSFEGKVQFINMVPYVDGTQIDNPVYRLVVTKINTDESAIFYLYHTTEDYAQDVAKRFEESTYLSATYIQVEENETNALLFDLSNYIEDGTYKVSLQTLAGLGVEKEDEEDVDDRVNYLLNAQQPIEGKLCVQTFFKLFATQFSANDGMLTFNQSYIAQDQGATLDNLKAYSDRYEITLVDGINTYVYEINRGVAGVNIDDVNHVVSYLLPNQIEADGKTIDIQEDKEYKVKIRALASENLILNSTFVKEGENDVEFVFKKSIGISDLRVENGILKWVVNNPETHLKTTINFAYLDEMDNPKQITKVATNENIVTENGQYLYHYLEITSSDVRNISNGYQVSAYVTENNATSVALLNSNISGAIEVNRLKTVTSSSIVTTQGVLVWEAIEGAVSYTLTISQPGMTNLEKTVATEELDLIANGIELTPGSYNIEIKANGDDMLNAAVSNKVEGFIQLNAVDAESISIVDGAIVWKAVENAEAYKIVFHYTDFEDASQTYQDIIESPIESEQVVYSSAPTGIKGDFTFDLIAMGDENSKLFNSKAVTREVKTSAPHPVNSVEYDDVNKNKIIIEASADFILGDTICLSYDLEAYVSGGTSAKEHKEINISYQQAEYYKSGSYYHVPLTTMGIYSNISVQVQRAGTVPSAFVRIAEFDLHLFSYGDGTNKTDAQDNRYRIFTATELLNIKYFSDAHFVLGQNIDFTGVDVNSLVATNGGYLIAEEFSGSLDGAKNSIYGFNASENIETITVNGSDFAMFKTLTGATIKDLNFGRNTFKLNLNMVANNLNNVVKLSLIATESTTNTATNAQTIIENVNFAYAKDSENVVINVENSTSASVTHKGIYIAGLVVDATNTSITSSSVQLKVNFVGTIKAQSTVTPIRVAGAVANATNTNINNSTINLVTDVDANTTVDYIGGAYAWFEGSSEKTTGVTNSNITITSNGGKVLYFGGVVGLGRNINVDTVDVTGAMENASINYNIYYGGLIGYSQNAVLNNSGSLLSFNISLLNSTNKYVGALVGFATTIDNGTSEITNCYCNIERYNLQTLISDQYEITLGAWGNNPTSSVTISGCYKK